MGLDQWFYKSKEGCFYGKVQLYDGSFSEKEHYQLPSDREEFFYFRKHYPLNEWIGYNAAPEDCYDFNCVPIECTNEILIELFNSVIKGEVTSEYEKHNQDILSFIREAFELQKDDYKIYYYAWW